MLLKLILSLRKPKIIIITGEGRACAAQALFQILKTRFSVRKIIEDNLPFMAKEDILIFETELKESVFRFFSSLIKKSKLPILAVTHLGDIPPEHILFSAETEKSAVINKLALNLFSTAKLILNCDDETVGKIGDKSKAETLTFGFQERADLKVSDINLNGGTNFKINHQGNSVPVWLDHLFGKEQIYSALSAAAVGIILGLNLVEISQGLKNYQSLPGKMRLIQGIKNSWILDDSASASVFSMTEALEILGKIELEKLVPAPARRIAVLGDILGIRECAIESSEAIGEKAAKSADLLFTFGPRAKFIAEGAKNKGMAIENIFQFDTVDEGKLILQDKIKEGDLILVDGSKEMEMKHIIDEIKML